MLLPITLIKTVLKKLIENWGLVALVVAILFFFLWNARGNDLEIANNEIQQLKDTILTQQKVTEQLTADKNAIQQKLQNALDSITSDDCGKTEVPAYLLKKQKEILGGK